MVNQQLIDYINQNRRQGATDEQIKESLFAAGWTQQDIEAAMKAADNEIVNDPAISENNHQSFINKWSWGGFLLYFFYFLGSRNYKRAILYFLGSFVPILDIYLWIKAGLRGRKLVWESGKWQDFESYRKRQELLDKIGLVCLLVLIIIILIGYFWSKNKIPKTPSVNQPINQEINQEIRSDVVISSDSDIDRVKAILDEISRGYLTGNNELVIKHVSMEEFDFFSSSKLIPVDSFNVNNISKVDSNIVANITTISEGESETSDIVFIKEGGDWKFSMKASIQYEIDKRNKNIGDPSGLPDLVVISAKVYPEHPIVNNKDVKIIITIKNIGTKISERGAPLEVELIGFKDLTPITGGDLAPLPPGATTTWSFKPYDKNDFFKISDVPGEKTLRVVLNGDRQILESNYDNNIFIQKLQIYAN